MWTVEGLIGTLVDSNEIVALWEQTTYDDNGVPVIQRIWKGMGHELPYRYLNRTVDRIFGTIPEDIMDADTINILII